MPLGTGFVTCMKEKIYETYDYFYVYFVTERLIQCTVLMT